MWKKIGILFSLVIISIFGFQREIFALTEFQIEGRTYSYKEMTSLIEELYGKSLLDNSLQHIGDGIYFEFEDGTTSETVGAEIIYTGEGEEYDLINDLLDTNSHQEVNVRHLR